MALPRKVQEAEEAANRLMEQVYAPQQPEAPQADPVKPKEQAAPAEAKQEAPAPKAIEAPAPSAPEAPKPATPAVDPNDETWEHRFKTLTGKYSSEVPRLAAELRELKGKLDQRERELEEMKKAPEITKMIKPEDIEEYGQPFIDLVQRAAQDVVSKKDAEIAKLQSKIDQIENRTTANAEADFYSKLADSVPDWLTVNENSDFHSWLSEPDELTGAERQLLLQDAEAKRDHKRVARFFLRWKETQSERASGASQSLSSQVSPSVATSQDVPPPKRIWTGPELDRFYQLVKQGRIGADEAAALEADINAALVEGRIR